MKFTHAVPSNIIVIPSEARDLQFGLTGRGFSRAANARVVSNAPMWRNEVEAKEAL